MLSIISFILVCVGCLNWLSIGILQYDFVAGIFGSQSNIFSRIIYALVGIASLVIIANTIKNKGKCDLTIKKSDKEYDEFMEDNKSIHSKRTLARAESAEDLGEFKKCDCDKDNCNCHNDKE